MGAWIETLKDEKIKSVAESHPTWVRGLKLEEQELAAENAASHPTWVRGLKPFGQSLDVAERLSHPTWVRGLKPSWRPLIRRIRRRTLRGCVD